MLTDSFLKKLRQDPEIRYYFRYPLHQKDFHEVRERGRLLGRIAAKPLYGKLSPEGKVDRSSGYSGRIAIIFIPTKARSASSARLVFTEISSQRITTSTGKRNWTDILAAAEEAVRKTIRGEGN